MGWLWFGGTLVPVIGLVQVGMQAHADRYTYIPPSGFLSRWSGACNSFEPKISRRRSCSWSDAAGLLGCVLLTYHQLGYWQTNVKLFTHALAHTENNPFSQNNLGVAYTHEAIPKRPLFTTAKQSSYSPKIPGFTTTSA